jgi:hypothetical protein
MKDKKLTDFILKVIAWSLIFIGYIFLILVLFKITHSPEENFFISPYPIWYFDRIG